MNKAEYTPMPGWFDLLKLKLPKRKMEHYAEIQALAQLYQRTAAYQRQYNPIQWENLKEVCAKMDFDLIKNYGALEMEEKSDG